MVELQLWAPVADFIIVLSKQHQWNKNEKT